MIKFVVLAIIIVLVSWSLGALAGRNVGYQQAYREMLPIIENLVNKIVKDWSESNGTLRPPKRRNTETP